VTIQLAIEDLGSVDIGAFKANLAALFGVDPPAIDISASAGSVVLDVKVSTPSSRMSAVESVVSADAATLFDTLGIATTIAVQPTVKVKAAITAPSAEAASSVVSNLEVALETPARASATLGVKVDSLTAATIQATTTVTELPNNSSTQLGRL
tara:strand:- start:272 stop:730 length:459 start_codon:yes stop_codon:yes gene_type:complete